MRLLMIFVLAVFLIMAASREEDVEEAPIQSFTGESAHAQAGQVKLLESMLIG